MTSHLNERERPSPIRAARRSLVFGTCLGLMLGGTGVRAADDVVIIVNKDNPFPVDRDFVIRIYTGAVRGWPDGSPVFALDQPEESEARQLFATTVLGKSVANLRAIWSQNIFTGRGMPPKVTSVDAEMKRLVSTNRNAIGYIRASQADASVRVVAR